MNSIGENCNELKKQYDNCFLKWFSGRFLKGDTNDEICAPFFKVYQQCVKVCTYCNNLKFVHLRGGDLL
jgi:TRIAP1/MDM35 family protein